jgi:tetratricopeptide (TPR) repeat protein
MVASEWFMSPLEALPKAKAAARKALELDSGSIAACVALGQTLALYDHDWPAAEKEFNEALAAAPEDARVRAAYAHLLLALNRLDDAIREGAKAVELDPIQPLTSHTLGVGYLLIGCFPQLARVSENAVKTQIWIAGPFTYSSRSCASGNEPLANSTDSECDAFLRMAISQAIQPLELPRKLIRPL